ncbi:MAG: CS domain-containing protein [Methanoregula sp.]|jgi:HSP20 family molecular chaperone IbpA|nr:CS domain-containing protein [Methanoregula sp.]
MQNNPNSPYDDVFNNLAKIVEDIVKNMPDNQHARIVGYTIITRHPSDGDPDIFPAGDPCDDGEIPYEVVESDDMIFITAKIPAHQKNAPSVDIQAECVQIGIDNRDVTIMLSHPVDRIHSYYRIHHGVMDLTLKKK